MNSEKFRKNVQRAENEVRELVSQEKHIDTINTSNVRTYIDSLRSARNNYVVVLDEFSQFLSRANTTESTQECELINTNARAQERDVTQLVDHMATYIGTSRVSSTRTSATEKRARAEAARIRLEYARKEAAMQKQAAAMQNQAAILDADLGVLREEKEAMAADIEAKYIEEAEKGIPPLDLPFQNPDEKSREYVDNLEFGASAKIKVEPGVYTVPPDLNPDLKPVSVGNKSGNDIDTLTIFLLRKELMPKRLQKFNEKSQTFHLWKTSFKTVMAELQASPEEEVDFLVSHLGNESRVWAESLHAANAADPRRGLELIWERLEHCFGSPEKIEESLRTRIENFPQVTTRDLRKLYDLSDLLLEIQSIKCQARYSTQFSMFDSSAGANLIVTKLPYNMQQKWIVHASRYKKDKSVMFPHFAVLVNFVSDMSKTYNDPAFQLTSLGSYDQPKYSQRPSKVNSPRMSNFKMNRGQVLVNRKTALNDNNSDVSQKTFESTANVRCPIHHAGHSLLDCNAFKQKTMEARRAFLKEKGICYRCLMSNEHMAMKCTMSIKCDKCGKGHQTMMHREITAQIGTEKTGGVNVTSKCTNLCGLGYKGRSCGKIVLVNVFNRDQPEKSEVVYAILDDQSNRSLIAPELCDKLNVANEVSEYTLSSCSGSVVMAGRRATGLSVSSLDGFTKLELPTLVECDEIPQDRSEIPTPEVALNFTHLEKLAQSIPPLEEDCEIQLLIGRDLPAAHHVLDQVLGPREAPFAVQLSLGWVIIGEVCLGKIHQPDSVKVCFTTISNENRGTTFSPCESFLKVKERESDLLFQKSPDDNKVGLSADDREFLKMMDKEFTKDDSGLWTAPLPFRTLRPTIPDNRDQAFKRAVLLKRSLAKNPEKCNHMVQFMQKIFDSDAAKKVSENEENGQERWYLPLFGVYHPKKRDKIRGVFDSSVFYKGCCLNELLLSGPNLTNSLLGVLLRFRRDKYAFTADIEQMFYRFLVNAEHRTFLRFLWFENNNPERPLVIYQMRVHVFGNRPSPAVATYGLRKAVKNAEPDVQQFVQRDFYVDDALASRPSHEEAVGLLRSTKEALSENGKIRLHKIASNDVEIMNKFPKEELSTTFKDLDLDDTLPVQHSLGLTWDLNQDVFSFIAPAVEKPFTRRGLLSTINSVFDPVGFVAPFTISGKMLLRKACPDGSSWDDPLPETHVKEWESWKTVLEKLNGYKVPRMYISESLSLASDYKICIFSDASESAIAAAGYVVIDRPDSSMIGFIMGKAKLAPKNGHSIPRLELCAAVLAVEVGTFIAEQLDILPSAFRFFTDSKVVLGYIYNRSRRFYTYVSNRVAQIHDFSRPEQWNHVATDLNPADVATRSISDVDSVHVALQKWLAGPTYLIEEEFSLTGPSSFPLELPDEDADVRPEVVVKTTKLESTLPSILDSAERFSTWYSFIRAICTLIHIARTFAGLTMCTGWHVCRENTAPYLQQEAKHLILLMLQRKHFPGEIIALQSNEPISRKSSIISLSPYLDGDGMLRVGGRIKGLSKDLGIASAIPLLVQKDRITKLLVSHYHRQTFHQGRHFTEGAIRSNGLWVIGAKRLVSSIIHDCVTCRKLRGSLLLQKMADLPCDRLSPGPPFSAVGVDVFGPWDIVTRRTRGGSANGKRWAVMFSCLTTRSTHIEVIEDMSASCFINALRRMVAIRGPVRILRSDRGTNFVGAADEIGAHVVNVEDPTFRAKLDQQGIMWYFNAPMRLIWEGYGKGRSVWQEEYWMASS
ncbi:uncharacterized protein LOC128210513 [Mya arenaria]|uniref:uncharacterized protein LOC128210513 n=1 Tax=Mya arenaria TaxID=6604 RepID=UPI0022E361EA|nr:uncharacterized protein LOC128210513 [Mya arenaria]